MGPVQAFQKEKTARDLIAKLQNANNGIADIEENVKEKPDQWTWSTSLVKEFVETCVLLSETCLFFTW